MKTVLVVSRKYHGEVLGDTSSFEKNGYKIIFSFSPFTLSKFDLLLRIKHKIGLDITKDIQNKRIKYNKSVLKLVFKYRPDIVYAVHCFL